MQLSAPATAPLDLLAAPAGVSDALLALVASAPTTPGVVPGANSSADFAALLPDAVPAPPLETNVTPCAATAIVPLADFTGVQLPASAIMAPLVAGPVMTATAPAVAAKVSRPTRAAQNSSIDAPMQGADARREALLTCAPRAARHLAPPPVRETDEPEAVLPAPTLVTFAQSAPVEPIIAAMLPVAANFVSPDAVAPEALVEPETDLSPGVMRQPTDRLVATTLPINSTNVSPSFTERVSLNQPWGGTVPWAPRRLETAAPSAAVSPLEGETRTRTTTSASQVSVPAPQFACRDDAPCAAQSCSSEAAGTPAPELAKKSAPTPVSLDSLTTNPPARPHARVGVAAVNDPSEFPSADGRSGATAPADVSSDGRGLVPQSLATLPASAWDVPHTGIPVSPGVTVPTAQAGLLDRVGVLPPPLTAPAVSASGPQVADASASLGATAPTAPTVSLDAPPALGALNVAEVATAAPTPSVRREEKIAAAFAKNFGEKNSGRASSHKTFLSTDNEEVTKSSPEIGIDVAKSSPTMPAFAITHHLASDAVFARVAPAHAMVASVEQAVQSEPLVATEAPAAAHRAVEAALAAAERFSAGDRHAVNLQFSVGGADLAVRVELRADEVRATFRTDSPELRSALAHEWSAVVTDAGERSFRLAPPVITSNSGDASGLAAFAGDSSPRQRDSQARRASHDVFASVASRARGAVSSTVDEIAARPGLLPTSLHLHTLA